MTHIVAAVIGLIAVAVTTYIFVFGGSIDDLTKLLALGGDAGYSSDSIVVNAAVSDTAIAEELASLKRQIQTLNKQLVENTTADQSILAKVNQLSSTQKQIESKMTEVQAFQQQIISGVDEGVAPVNGELMSGIIASMQTKLDNLERNVNDRIDVHSKSMETMARSIQNLLSVNNLDFIAPVGSITFSWFEPTKFASVFGSMWVLADGRSVDPTSKWTQLTGLTVVPDLRGQFLRAYNGSRDDQFMDPRGANAEPGKVYASTTGLSRAIMTSGTDTYALAKNGEKHHIIKINKNTEEAGSHTHTTSANGAHSHTLALKTGGSGRNHNNSDFVAGMESGGGSSNSSVPVQSNGKHTHDISVDGAHVHNYSFEFALKYDAETAPAHVVMYLYIKID